MKHRRPPKLHPSLYVGPHRIFFTMCTFERKTAFTNAPVVDLVRDQLLRTSRKFDVAVIAYCFMPDHLHGLIEGMSADADLLTCISRFRQSSGFAYRSAHRDYLWQEGYDDRFLRAEEATLDVVAYIVANPLRGGRCLDARDYPFIGSSRYSIDELIAAIQTLA